MQLKIASLSILLALVPAATGAQPAPTLSPTELLGRMIYFDDDLSTPPGQACATCHAPEVGFTGPDSDINLATGAYPGAVHKRFGNRKPPTAAYGGLSPVMYYDEEEELWLGGMFWDGRATGWRLGDPLAEQAIGPFLNPLEHNNPGARQVLRKISKSSYFHLFAEAYGAGAFDLTDVPGTYDLVGRAIAAYERSAEVNPYTSKFDYYLAGEVDLSPQEAWGLELFEGRGMCNLCHISEPGENGEPPVFTDFSYDNLGIPKNHDLPFYYLDPEWNLLGLDYVDYGLGAFLESAGHEDQAEENYGKHKVPTLRNVDKRPYPGFVKAFGHNGYFKSLEDITHFYNTRDVAAEGWPAAEVPLNVNTDELGNLGLSLDEELAIVAFMRTLSDGYDRTQAPLAAAKAAQPGPAAARLALTTVRDGGSTRLSFSLPREGSARLDLYDLRGRHVATLAQGRHGAGEHRVAVDRGDLASGLYLARLATEVGTATTKVTVLR